MKAIEFETGIQNGLIVLPPQYRNFNAVSTRVIVLVADEQDISLVQQKKERLRQAFKKLQDVNPFREITNASAWQNDLRNEWDRGIIG